jgi:hypothetical protein
MSARAPKSRKSAMPKRALVIAERCAANRMASALSKCGGQASHCFDARRY